MEILRSGSAAKKRPVEFSHEAEQRIAEVSRKLKKYKLKGDIEKTINEVCSKAMIEEMETADKKIDDLVKVIDQEAADKQAQRDKKAKEKADKKSQPQNALPIS